MRTTGSWSRTSSLYQTVSKAETMDRLEGDRGLAVAGGSTHQRDAPAKVLLQQLHGVGAQAGVIRPWGVRALP